MLGIDKNTVLEENSVEIIKVNLDSFYEWFSLNSYKILKDTLESHEIISLNSGSVWIIYLGSKTKKNFEIGIERGVWAFKPRRGISDIIRIKKGDKIIFLSLKGVQAQSLPINAHYHLSKVFIFDCVKGHYLQISDEQDPFRITGKEREYYNFIGTKKLEDYSVDIPSEKISKELREVIRSSYNESGSPRNIGLEEYKQFINLINFDKERRKI